MIERAPIVYQEVDRRRRVLSGRYVRRGARQIGFEVANYDSRRALVIDPALVYSTYLGGSGQDISNSIAVDDSGTHMLRATRPPLTFPTTTGAYQGAFGGGFYDAFVGKLNATGTALVYSTYLGGSSLDQGTGIAVDPSGNAYVTGVTQSSNFPTTPGAFQTTLAGATNGFITKLNATGTALIYSTYLGGTSQDQATAIAVDSSGNAYVTGLTESSDFPITPGAFQTSYSTSEDSAFVTKLNATGTTLVSTRPSWEATAAIPAAESRLILLAMRMW